MSRIIEDGLIAFTAALMLGVLLFSGCATAGIGSPAPRTGQEQAVWVIWHDAYHREDKPPKVRWLEGDRLTCTDPNSGKPGFPIPVVPYWPAPPEPPPVGPQLPRITDCREGFTWSPLEVLVAWHGEPSFSETALAHELLHAARLRDGDWRDQHEVPDFQPTIDAANAALEAAGL